jgi:hypothetical protein
MDAASAGRDRAEGEEVKSSDPQQLLDLIAQLLVLIECAGRLPPSRERISRSLECNRQADAALTIGRSESR